MAAPTQGIQQLLSAEKRAAEKVNEARKRKMQRLKQAKQEAQAEIQEYRQEREATFKKHQQAYLDSIGDVDAKIKEEIENQLASMKDNVAKKKDIVIERLMQLVCDIHPELHHNLRLQKKIMSETRESSS